MTPRITSLLVFLILADAANAQEIVPLHQQVDQLIDASQGDLASHASSRSGDAEFLRRIQGMDPIKRVIDKYLGTVTTVFVVLVVGGVLVLTQLGGSEDGEAGPCSGAALEQPLATGG